MAKQTKVSLSVQDLEQMLEDAKAEVEQLQKERAGLEKRLAEIDARLAVLSRKGKPPQKAATPKPAAKKPGRKKMTIPQHIEKILKDAGKPVATKDIAAALKKKGVSKSAKLDQQVYQAISQGKVAAKKVSRGVYELAGGAEKAKAAPGKKTTPKAAKKKAAKKSSPKKAVKKKAKAAEK